MDHAEGHELKDRIRKFSEAMQDGVCDSLNMCKKREESLAIFGGFEKTPNFCPYCGKEWFASAISDRHGNPIK